MTKINFIILGDIAQSAKHLLDDKDKSILYTFIKNGIKFTEQQFFSLFLSNNRSGRSTLLIFKKIKSVLEMPLGKQRVIDIRDHYDTIRSHDRLFKELINYLKKFPEIKIHQINPVQKFAVVERIEQ